LTFGSKATPFLSTDKAHYENLLDIVLYSASVTMYPTLNPQSPNHSNELFPYIPIKFVPISEATFVE